MQISISRNQVFREVTRRMEWTGTRSPIDNDYPRVALSQADHALLHSLFDDAAMHVVDICRPLLRSVVNSDDGLMLSLSIPSTTDLPTLTQTVENLLTNHILSQWEEIVAPSRVAATQLKCADISVKLQSIIYHHPAPKRTVSTIQQQ